jgi:hypothetical protein
MKFNTIQGAVAGLFLVIANSACTVTGAQSNAPQYFSPVRNAKYVSTGATIVVRYGPMLSERSISGVKFNVRGSRSGVHAGQTILADDHKTVIFRPQDPFTAGEHVQVDISGLQIDAATRFQPLSHRFDVAVNQQPGSVSAGPPPANPPRSAFPSFLTVPQDIPHFSISETAPDAAEGDILVAPFYWTGSTVGSYLLILT